MAAGDHLYVHRHAGSLTHHGIDCGDGTVIHYQEGEAILRSSKAFFAAGKAIQVKHYDRCDPPNLAIKRAESRLGERDYNLVFNNCEHFATWCKTGQHQSEQVNQILAASFVGGAVGGLAAGGVFALPALAAAGVYGVHKWVEQAQQAKDPAGAIAALQSALNQLETARNEVKRECDRACQEAYRWDCTARLALQRNREDLARAAIARKLQFKQQALNTNQQLEQLETLILSLKQQHATTLKLTSQTQSQ